MTNENRTQTEDTRTFRPERFVSNGDDEFNNDWEILESEEANDPDADAPTRAVAESSVNSGEARTHQRGNPDDQALKEHPPYTGAPKIADSLREVARQFGVGQGAKGRGKK